MARDRPRKPASFSGRWLALTLAIAVHVAFVAVLVFSLRWQNRKAEPVTAELYAPAPKTQVVELPTPETPAQPRAEAVPEPVSEPKPAPRPEPARPPERAPEPRREPAPPKSKAEPKVEKPDPHAAEIARKARAEEERKQREQAARERKEREKKEADQREAEKRKQDEQRRAAEVREAEALKAQAARERQAREAEALKAQAAREQAAREAQQKAQAEASARSRAEADYIGRIRTKVKGNVILPPDMAGNPEAIFDVVQLPTGEIIDTVLRKSSGVRAYDDAVQRAILKSSPLPQAPPDRPELFQRTLTLKFRPQD